MQDLRVKNKPATSCEDFELFHIRDDKWFKKRTHRIKDVDLFIQCRTYKQIIVSDTWQDWMHRGVWGFVCADRVKQKLKGIDWDKYTVRTMQGTRELTQSDIIAAYNDFLHNEKWHTDYINHYEEAKC